MGGPVLVRSSSQSETGCGEWVWLLRLVRTNAVTVNDVLDGHKLQEIDCADRVYLTLSVPNLVVGGQVVSFLTVHEPNPVPSPTLLERRGQAFRRAVDSFAEANDIPVLAFAGKRGKGRPGCWRTARGRNARSIR